MKHRPLGRGLLAIPALLSALALGCSSEVGGSGQGSGEPSTVASPSGNGAASSNGATVETGTSNAVPVDAFVDHPPLYEVTGTRDAALKELGPAAALDAQRPIAEPSLYRGLAEQSEEMILRDRMATVQSVTLKPANEISTGASEQ